MTPTDLAILKSLLDRSIPKVVDGTNGTNGADGSQGLTGLQGDTGADGKQGPSGNAGKDAVDGLTGANGTDGADGTNGTDGEVGKSGASGKAGKAGKVGKVGPEGDKGDKGDDGRGIKSISVNEQDMLVVTYDDGDMTIAGKVSVTRESTGGSTYTGSPVGTFGISGTSLSSEGELVLNAAWGRKFNTGIKNSSSGVATLDFGTGSNTAETTVTGIPSVNQNSVITAQLRIEPTLEHPVDDLLFDPIRVAVKSVQEGQGFTLFGIMDNSEANGTYKVQWALS